jgi:hypothetical protein
MEPFAALLLYFLRFTAISLVVLMWAVALDTIESHARDGSVTLAKSATMAVAVSVVAVGAIAASYGAVPYGRIAGESPVVANEPSAGRGCERFSYSFTYAFGLERPASGSEDCSETF